MPRSKQPLTPPLGFFVSFFSSAAAAGGFWFFFASRATRFNNVDLITKSFCRSFCKACTSSALTTMPIALLASIKNFHQRFGGIASQIGFLDIFVRVAFHLCGEKLGAKPFFGFARGSKHSQLYALIRNVVGREQNREIWGFRAAWSDLQHLHDIV